MIREFSFYAAPGGGETVEREIKKAKLSRDEASVLEVVLDRIECGDHLPDDVKHLRGEIWEARVAGERRTFRLLYARVQFGNVPLGLVFFAKKTRKTPRDAIDLAERRLRLYGEHN